MLKSKKIVDWLYNYSLYFIIGALLLVIIAIEPSFVRVSNFTTILTQSATKIIYACGIAGIIVLGGTDLALGREVGLAAVVLLRFYRQSITPSAFSALTRFPHCR